jgi:quercetin dioxygenase-like cupin family protein
MTIKYFHRDEPGMMVPFISKDARLVVWLGAGARTANMNYVVMEPGEENVPHIHPESEDTIMILEGVGTIKDHDNDVVHEFAAGDVIHVPIGVMHAVRADRGSRIVSAGGPCPADTTMLRKADVDVDSLLAILDAR